MAGRDGSPPCSCLRVSLLTRASAALACSEISASHTTAHLSNADQDAFPPPLLGPNESERVKPPIPQCSLAGGKGV